MRKIHTVLRLHYENELSRRAIAQSLKIGYGTVDNYLRRAQACGLTWPLPAHIGERELGQLLFPSQPRSHRAGFSEPDFNQVHQELKAVGMTKLLAWEEYRQCHPEDGYSYSQFCHRYRAWLGQQKRSMRQVHVAGEKCFVDYCGPTIGVIDGNTGEIHKAQIFVAVLGASNYTFANASLSQTQADWIDSHIKAFEYFGGMSTLVVPDNLKAGVIKAHRYTPTLNESYQHWADYCGTAIIPARPYRPKDKAKAEVAVLVVERWIIARLRHHTFFSLGQLNAAIAQLLEELNNRAFKKLPGCRRTLFEQLDQPALNPLPRVPYAYLDVRRARVGIDYHIEYGKHYYSVPHALGGNEVEVRAGNKLLSIYAHGKRVACHARSNRPYGQTTLTEHMPRSHQAHATWSAERFERWANDIGPATLNVVRHQLQRKRHPELSFRSVMGLLNLAKQYDRMRLEAACSRAMAIGSPTRTSVASILKYGLDKHTGFSAKGRSNQDDHLQAHDNVRGADYFH